jgi:hypothetical protein
MTIKAIFLYIIRNIIDYIFSWYRKIYKCVTDICYVCWFFKRVFILLITNIKINEIIFIIFVIFPLYIIVGFLLLVVIYLFIFLCFNIEYHIHPNLKPQIIKELTTKLPIIIELREYKENKNQKYIDDYICSFIESDISLILPFLLLNICAIVYLYLNRENNIFVKNMLFMLMNIIFLYKIQISKISDFIFGIGIFFSVIYYIYFFLKNYYIIKEEIRYIDDELEGQYAEINNKRIL